MLTARGDLRSGLIRCRERLYRRKPRPVQRLARQVRPTRVQIVFLVARCHLRSPSGRSRQAYRAFLRTSCRRLGTASRGSLSPSAVEIGSQQRDDRSGDGAQSLREARGCSAVMPGAREAGSPNVEPLRRRQSTRRSPRRRSGPAPPGEVPHHHAYEDTHRMPRVARSLVTQEHATILSRRLVHDGCIHVRVCVQVSARRTSSSPDGGETSGVHRCTRECPRSLYVAAIGRPGSGEGPTPIAAFG